MESVLIGVYKTQRRLEKLPPLRVPQRPLSQPANPEIGQLIKEGNELLNVSVSGTFCHVHTISASFL